MIRFHWINIPLTLKLKSKIFGFYTFSGCTCMTCMRANGGKSGWGINLLFFGFSVS